MTFTASLRKLVRRSHRARIVGHLDRVEAHAVAGWAADLSDFAQVLRVVLVADGRPVAIAVADGFRSDLRSAGIGAGAHAYDIATPNLRRSGAQVVDVFALREADAAALVDVAGRQHLAIDAARWADIVAARRGRIVHLGRLAVPRRPVIEHGLYARPDPDPITFLDVYDLLVFLEQRVRVTGIQRVVSGLIVGSLRDPARYSAFEFCSVTDGGDVIVLPRAELSTLVDKALSGHVSQQDLRDAVASIYAAGRRVTFRAGDRYVVMGAYWLNPDLGSVLLRLRARGVVIGAYVYDLIPFTAAGFVTATNLKGVVDSGIEVLSLCDYFLTISEFVAGQLRSFLARELGHMPLAQAVTLPHELPGSSGAEATASPAHPRPYVLCVGTLEGRKNHLLLFDVWSALIRKYGEAAVPDLVLVGKWGWLIDEFRSFCEATEYLSGKVVLKEDISDAELLALYRGSLLTTFPSFVEGWGLPVGESLAVGKLCIASMASSIPEVGGEFADYIDPHDALGAFDVFERGIFDETYRAGRERQIASSFRARTWEETTDAFHASIQTLAAAAPSHKRHVPVLAVGEFVAFDDLMEDPLRSWGRKLSKLALADGWHEFERWGAWSSRSDAALRFFTDRAPGDAVVVSLRLVLPPGLDEMEVRIDSGSHARLARLRGTAPHHVDVDVVAGEGGRIDLTIRSDGAGFGHDGLRELHVGLSGLGIGMPDLD